MDIDSVPMLCKLCKKECAKAAKSHIVSRGFFAKEPSGKLLITACGNGASRKLPDALWDDNLVCQSCEHEIFAPLDEYAINVFSRMITAKRWSKGEGTEIAVFESVDRRRLRAFLGSLLWRCSASVLPECRFVDIGRSYEKRIAEDLLSDGQLSYIDAITTYLTGDWHGGVVLSGRTRLGQHNDSRVNGFNISIPHLNFLISLDQRPHPLRDAFDGPLQLDGKAIMGSMSLSMDKVGYSYILPIMETLPHEDQKIYATFGSYLKNAKYVRKVHA